MSRFLARVSVTIPFAEERMKELGAFGNKLLGGIKTIGDKYNPEVSMVRLTFASYYLEAPTREECRKAIEEGFEYAYPQIPLQEGISEIMITPQYDDATFELMRQIYNNLYGVEEYQRLTTELTDAAQLLRIRGAMEVLRLQNYLFAIDGGAGFTTLLSSLGDYLNRMHVFEEQGEGIRDHYYELILGSETSNGYYSEDDLISFLSDVDEDQNPYDIIGIDVSKYLDGKKFDDLRRFLHRLEPYQEEFVFAFRIPFLEQRAFDEIKNLFTDQMLLKTVRIAPFPDVVLMENFWNLMNQKEFIPDVSLMDVVAKRIHKEKMDGRFYGFKTLNKIASEAMFLKALDYADEIMGGKEGDAVKMTSQHVTELIGQEKEELTGYAALKELIGMEEITEKVREIIAQVKFSIKNEKLDRPCIHMRFTGAPGTGKTTVARIIGQIMREEGILRKGGFFEYSGRDLVAEYVGQTAVKTASICRDSYGSVLFIDEAYALYDEDSKTNDFGKEALTTLISEMENHRDDMLVVMAGYTDEMDTLMKANPGIRSRMPRILHFPNYTKEQLYEIFMFMVRKHFEYAPELETAAKEFFDGLSKEYMDSKEFANARFVRNIYERTWSKAALRCTFAGINNIVLTKEDFLAASSEKEFSEKIEHKKVLGF